MIALLHMNLSGIFDLQDIVSRTAGMIVRSHDSAIQEPPFVWHCSKIAGIAVESCVGFVGFSPNLGQWNLFIFKIK
jgi:hypothetical protein